MRKPETVKSLIAFGRIRLSHSFFMRDFLHSEIAQIHQLSNIPDNPKIAIRTGTSLCKQVLEPIQQKFGRISIRSGYRSPEINATGAQNKNQYNCASNQKNYSGHIWDHPDQHGHFGATACVVINSYIEYYDKTKDWMKLAEWLHQNITAYSDISFFPHLCAFNISWHEKPKKKITSYISPKGIYKPTNELILQL